MKKVIILCATLSFLVMPISLLANDASVQKVDRLEKRMTKLTDQIDTIVTNSRRAREISEKYKKIAMEHLTVVSDFTEQKSECQNLEDFYEKQKRNNNLDPRVKRKQAKNVIGCYKTLEALIYDFEDMSKDFSKLKTSIKTLNDMSTTDQASISSLEKQAKSIEGIIQMEKNKAVLTRNDVEDAINKSAN